MQCKTTPKNSQTPKMPNVRTCGQEAVLHNNPPPKNLNKIRLQTVHRLQKLTKGGHFWHSVKEKSKY